MNRLNDIESLIAPTAEAMGFALVRLAWTGRATPTLQVMAERTDGTMNADDCAALSRAVSAVLDVEDPIAGEYMLEVSSPGIDRPLVRAVDFERFAGYQAKLESSALIDGRKRFRGRLLGLKDNGVEIELDEGPVVVPLDMIEAAKLLLSDDLIKASLRQQAKRVRTEGKVK